MIFGGHRVRFFDRAFSVFCYFPDTACNYTIRSLKMHVLFINDRKYFPLFSYTVSAAQTDKTAAPVRLMTLCGTKTHLYFAYITV